MTNPTPVRLIFVGLKGINQWHYLPATRISDAVTLVAGVDPAPAARDQFHEKSGVPVYESLKDACSKHGAEGVVIGPPIHPGELSPDEITGRGREWILATMERISPQRATRPPAA